MNKLFSRAALGFAALALCLGTGVAVGGATVFSQTPIAVHATEQTIYTLDTTDSSTQGTNNSYTGNCDVTYNGIAWNVTGNAQMNPWRIGGKSITGTDRTVYTKTKMTDQVSRVELTVGAADSITVNSLTLTIASDDSFSTVIDEVSKTFKASSTISFEPTASDYWAADSFYKFTFNVTVSGSSNKFIQFSKVDFVQTIADTATAIVVADEAKTYLKKVGETYNLPASIQNPTGSEGALSFVSSDPSVATIDSASGLITAAGVGKTTITISADGLDDFVYDFSVLSAHDGTKEDPLTGQEAYNICTIAGDTTTTYYVAGYVSSVSSSSTVYYYIDDGIFEFYRPTIDEAYKDVEIAVGTYIRGYGQLLAFKEIVEFSGGTIDYVKNPEINSVAISGSMTKTSYYSTAADWNPAGLTVTAHYDDGHESVISKPTYSYSVVSPRAAGATAVNATVNLNLTITATAENGISGSITLPVKVTFDEPNALSVSGQQTSFTAGSKFSLGAGTLTATHASEASVSLALDEVAVRLGDDEIDVDTYLLQASDNGKSVSFTYSIGGVSVELNDAYIIEVVNYFIAGVNVIDYASSNSITSGMDLPSIPLDDVVTASAVKIGGSYNPKYYSDWRIYQNSTTGNSVLTIALPEAGYSLLSVTFTFTVSNTGILVLNSDKTTKLTSGTAYECSGTSLELTVGNSGTATNGQVRITGIEVKYTYDAFGQWCSDFVGKYACDPTGANAPSVSDWEDRGLAFLDLEQTAIDYATTITADQGGNILEQAFAKYDYIVGKYDTASNEVYDDFAERVASGKIVYGANKQLIGESVSSNTIALIAICSIGVLAVGGLLLARKKEER